MSNENKFPLKTWRAQLENQTKIDRATVPARRDLDPRTSALCVRGSYYEYNVRGYAVIPGVDIRCHAFSHQYRVIKLNSTKKKK